MTKIIKMNKKVKIYFTNFFPIGSRTLQNFYLSIKYKNANASHKSPVIYGGKPIFQNGQPFFYVIELQEDKQQLTFQLFLVDRESNAKTVGCLISEVKLQKNVNPNQQTEAIFYEESKKIGILNYVVSLQSDKQQNKESICILKTETNYNQYHVSEDFQDERYLKDFTPTNSNQSSFVKFDSYSEMTKNNIFDNLDESSIIQRHPFQNDKSFMGDSLIQQKKQYDISSLQKWLRKLKNVESQKIHSSLNFIELRPVIPQKYLESKDQNDTKLNLKQIKIKLKNQQNFNVKSLSLNFVDDQEKISSQQVFSCNFSLLNMNQKQKINDNVDQIKFKNFIVQIPSNKNFQLKMLLESEIDKKKLKQVSGIFIKDKFLNQQNIPLFTQDQKIFGTLTYKAKKIQSVSVQCLPPIEQNPFQSSNQNDALSYVSSSPDKNTNLKNKIRQRKLNMTMMKKQVKEELKIKKYSYDEWQDKQIVLKSLKSPQKIKTNKTKVDILKPSVKQNSQISSQNQFQRSNTQQLPYFQIQTSNERKLLTNRSQASPNKYEISKIKNSLLNSQKRIQKDESPSKNSQKLKNNRQLLLRSTNLTDLEEEQSQEQESYLNGNAFDVSLNNSNSQIQQMLLINRNRQNSKQTINKKQDQFKSLSQFIIEISSVTLILYQNSSSGEEQSGKFLILKSDKGETFITETLFSSHLNLSWKKKSYQFTSSLIEIQLFERTGYSSQCQNKHNCSVVIKFIDLMKAIKQNFYRQQIWVNGQAIGTIVLLYDILMQRQKVLKREEYNGSQMQVKNMKEKFNRSINKSELLKKTLTRNEQKFTIKIQSQLKNRRRAKTLESNKNSIFLPSIEKTVSRKSKVYEGGKNIKIGRAQRFISYNMAEHLGQL